MRLWSLHPKHLDQKGLVALWRESLLAQKVLQGKIKGYKKHPQLERFRKHSNPVLAISSYLHVICDEADKRGYNFQREKIFYGKEECEMGKAIWVTNGQVLFERDHLKEKVKARSLEEAWRVEGSNVICVHPIFHKGLGMIESWEKS